MMKKKMCVMNKKKPIIAWLDPRDGARCRPAVRATTFNRHQ